MKKILNIMLVVSVVANLGAMVLSCFTIDAVTAKQDALSKQLEEAEKGLVLSELRARQALDELHSLKMGVPRKAYTPDPVDVLPDTPGAVKPLVEPFH